MNNQNKVIHTNQFRKPSNPVNPDVIDESRQQGDNRGGGDNVKNDYVTHKEFDDATRDIDQRFNNIDQHLVGIEHDLSAMSKLQWWIMGIISAGIILPLLALLFKDILK